MADIQINYSKESRKFLDKNQSNLTIETTRELIIKAVKNIVYKGDENIDLKKMKGSISNQYRIRTGKIRILFSLINGIITIVDVKEIDFRGNIYKK